MLPAPTPPGGVFMFGGLRLLETIGTNFRSDLSRWAEVIVGNENAGSFEPHVRYKCWGETWFSLGLPGGGVAPSFDGDKIIWTGPVFQTRFYEREASDRWKRGGFEFDIVLTSKPREAKLSIPFEMSGLKANYQPPLTPFEIARGNKRPGDVVGSYAFYHATRTSLHTGDDGPKYQTGKAFHLYRPLAVDARGAKRWLDITLAVGMLTVTLDPAWFSAAEYPVIIDPTIGYDTQGASVDNTNSFILADRFTAPAAGGTPATFHAYVSHQSSSIDIMGGAYEDGGATPDGSAAVHTTAAGPIATTSTSITEVSGAIDWSGITGTDYWLSVNNEDGGNTAYDSGGGPDVRFQERIHSDNMPDPWPTGIDSLDWTLSVWVEYTAAPPAGFVPYPRYPLTGGMQTLSGGV